MLLTEFDEKKYKRTVFREGYEEGEQAGYSKGEQAGYSKGEQAGYGKGRSSLLEEKVQKKLQCGKDLARIADELEEELSVIQEIVDKIGKI